MRQFNSWIAVFLFSACGVLNKTSKSPSSLEYVSVKVVSQDDQSADVLTLRYVNNDHRTICFSNDTWPTPTGTMHYAQDSVWLTIFDDRYPIRKFNVGKCLGETCLIKLAPGDEITATIPYTEFELEPGLYDSPKQLTFPLTGWICDF